MQTIYYANQYARPINAAGRRTGDLYPCREMVDMLAANMADANNRRTALIRVRLRPGFSIHDLAAWGLQ